MQETIDTATTTTDAANIIFQKAVAFVNDTEQNLFLTGKAGTGKTTFLKYIQAHTNKQCAVVAPTGVAAINAGGETIHSFLQLPFSPFIPGTTGGFGRQVAGAEDKHSLLANLRLRDTKLKLLRRLELLIIDEVSMVRADLLDAMDLVLRHVRKNPLPFGGVQMLFIGDLFQLPPVAQEDEWRILGQYYASPYFFDSKALAQNPPVYIELKKVYRQKEQTFINILNRVRSGLVTQEDIDILNQRYDPKPQQAEGAIILSTHNRIADAVNQESLQRLEAPAHTFKGTITNEFSTRNLPTEEVLTLKAGAQIMFVKNDLQTPRRYFNGKIGRILSIDNDGIRITFPGEEHNEPLLLELETWKNMRYTLNPQTGQIEEEESGSFTQYPIRLAWAVTVHKSQGLTLQKAVVDLSQSFAPGQVYVALSRCTSIEGLVLRSRLHMDNVIVDERITAFAESERTEDELDALLHEGARQAMAAQVGRVFSFTHIITHTEQLLPELLKRKTGPKEKSIALHEQIMSALTQAQKHAEGFRKQVRNIILLNEDATLPARKTAAITYFTTQVLDPLLAAIDEHIAGLGTLTKAARQVRTWKELHTQLKLKAEEIRSIM